ncbi:MAG: DUF1294 domain-containing protein [Firmicutes bacterium]|nr:DUF1294 domain-containing protein [Bacillota bacterium]
MFYSIIPLYLIIINASAFLLMLIDKQKARRGAWRIPEVTLLASAILGGSVGALAGMYCFRHKTRHVKFSLGIPLILTVQIALAVFLR